MASWTVAFNIGHPMAEISSPAGDGTVRGDVMI